MTEPPAPGSPAPGSPAPGSPAPGSPAPGSTGAVTPPEKDALHRAQRPLRRGTLMGRAGVHLLGDHAGRVGLAWIAVMVLGAVFAPLLASSHPLVWKVDGEVSSPWLRHLTAIDVVLFASFFIAVSMAVCVKWGGLRGGIASGVRGWAWITSALALGVALMAMIDNLGTSRGRLPLVAIMLGCLLLVLAVLLATLPLGANATRRFKLLVAVVGLGGAVTLGVLDLHPPANVVYSSYREATARGEVQWQVLAPLPYSPSDFQRDAVNAGRGNPTYNPPSWRHPLGTEAGGADVLSRMIHACRIALAIGLIATGIAVAIGIVVGGFMGYFAGWVDLLGMRLVEVFSAIPVIYLLIMIVAFYGRNLYLMMFILGLTGWVGYAVFVRAEFLKMRQMDYVQAAKAVGTPLPGILFRHMLPNGLTPVLVLASFGIASAILTESTLSFIGLGLVEEPSWGALLNQGRVAGSLGQWGLTVFPGLAIFLTVLAYNLVGEALRDAIDPRAITRGE